MMRQPKKPLKQIIFKKSETFFGWKCGIVPLEEFKMWLDTVVPRGAQNVVLHLTHDYSDDWNSYLEVEWEYVMEDPEYDKELKKYRRKLKKWQRENKCVQKC